MLAGVVFNVLLIARAALTLFQAVSTAILPHLTRLRAGGQTDPFRRSVNLTLLAIAGFAGLVALVMLAAGPALMDLLFGGDFDYERGGLVLVALGMGLYLSAATLNQALLAHARAGQASAVWVGTAAAFVLFLLLVELDDRGAAGRARLHRRRGAAQRGAATRSIAAPDGPYPQAMAKKPQLGEPAPDFELEGTGGSFRLSDHRGERVVLLFYPGDNTAVCTKQFCSYRDNSEAFGSLDATVVGISAQSVESHRGFSDKHDLNVPLLADESGEVAKALRCHVRGWSGTKRAVIIVDEEGIVRHRHDHLFGLDFQTVGDLRAALESLPAPRLSAVRGAGLRVMTETILIPERFNGPPGSANGGYTCGLVAGLVGAEEVRVSLRSPPPLDTPMAVLRRRRAGRAARR